MRKKVYLAIPYSHPNPKERDKRAKIADVICATLMKEGYLVFSPISQCHHIAEKYDLPKGYEYWKELDESFIDWSDEVFVIPYPGWDISVGVTMERRYAEKTNKPVKFLYEYLTALELGGVEYEM